ncbi:hypothetical protein B0H63DRAFT_556466 [Podospora didyma]|uniref:BTB domain-containing protein n=1 Tax=Podospora didyma TaxID=330526 RepID=A0AAE0NXA3_9PEZI|nr:hypothetical protein B0H63DRAFT_556466 [Podospora didyma]
MAPTARLVVMDPDGDLLLRVGLSSTPDNKGADEGGSEKSPSDVKQEKNSKQDADKDKTADSTQETKKKQKTRKNKKLIASRRPTMELSCSKSALPPCGEGEWEVSFPEDNPEAFIILLNIIHSRFALVPKSPSLSQLYDLLVLIDKYDAAHIVRPWVDDWMNAASAPIGPDLDIYKAAYVAYELGNEKRLSSLIQHVVLNIKPMGSFSRKSTWDESKGILHPILEYSYERPLDLLRTAKMLKKDLLDRILSKFHKYMNQLALNTAGCVGTPGSGFGASSESYSGYHSGLSRRLSSSAKCNAEEMNACKHAILGALCADMMVSRGGILPPSSSGCTDTALKLMASIEKAVRSVRGLPGHEKCAQLDVERFTKDVQNDFCAKQSMFTEAQKKHMEMQRQKTGLKQFPEEVSVGCAWVQQPPSTGGLFG